MWTMKTRKSNVILTIIAIQLLTGCGGDNDPGGKLWWTIIGFPLLGVAYIVGGLAISIFQSKEEKTKADSPEPVPAIIVGVIIMVVIYNLFKAIF